MINEDSTLGDLLVAIRGGAAARGLTVYDTLLVLPTEKEGQIAYPWADWNGDPAAFLDIAATVGPSVLYVAATRFDLDAELWQEVRTAGYRSVPDAGDDAQSPSELPTDPACWLHRRLQERTAEWAGHDGEISGLHCVWMKDGVAHEFGPQADWLAAFRIALDEAAMDGEAVLEEERRLRSNKETTRLHDRAGEMARHPRYAEATNDAKREYMAEQLFPELDPLDCRHVASLAALMYWWHVEPVERVSTIERVRELYDAGETMTSIAALLKVSREKVRAALAEAKENS